LAEGVIELTPGNTCCLIAGSFFGGWACGALGLGGGAIFNPLLLSMNVPPKVASASGMYMIIFATGATCTTYILSGMLNIGYGLWVGGFNILGTILGMYLLDVLMKKLNRSSPLVCLLSFVFVISAIAVPVFGVPKA
jgi:uncharacterized membrane protein YfcA